MMKANPSSDVVSSIPLLTYVPLPYDALHPYLISLEEEYQNTGLPFIREMSLAYPDLRPMRTQFLYGPDILVAPVLKRNTTKVRVYIPDDSFVFAYDKKAFVKGWHAVSAPLGKPVFFVKKDSEVGANLEGFLENA